MVGEGTWKMWRSKHNLKMDGCMHSTVGRGYMEADGKRGHEVKAILCGCGVKRKEECREKKRQRN